MRMRAVSLILFFLLASAFLPLAGCAGEQDIVKFGTDLMIEGDEGIRDAVVIAGDIIVDGSVERDVIAIGGSVTLTNKAVVGRNVIAVSGQIQRGTGAEVGGNITEVNIPGLYTLVNAFSGGDWTGPFLFFAAWSIVSFIGLLALALLISVFFPGTIDTVSSALHDQSVRSAVVGIIGMLLLIPVGVLLAISVIGIVLIPVEVIFVSISFLFGYVAAARLIGMRLLKAIRRPPATPVWETLWGTILLALVGFIPVLGWLINALAVIFGFGGVLNALLQRQHRPQRRI